MGDNSVLTQTGTFISRVAFQPKSDGVLWRVPAPKSVKRIRRATLPFRIVRRAVAPAPVRKAKRAASGVVQPIETAEQVGANAVVMAVRGSRFRRQYGTNGPSSR